jgi:hypothetical protein
MSDRRAVLGGEVLGIGLLPATEAVAGSRLGVVWVEGVLAGFG